MNNTIKNIAAAVISFAVAGVGVYFIQRWDNQAMESILRRGHAVDITAFHPTEMEQRIAKQFSDTTLPQLKRLGLIMRYTRTEIETIITVSGTIWNKRSTFFKESLLDQILIYNKVNSFAVQTRIIDDRTNRLYAEIIPPNEKIFY